MAENFLNLAIHVHLQIQEAERTPYPTNPKTQFTLRHGVVRLLKAEDKEDILKAVREYASLTYRGKQLEQYWISCQKLWRLEGRMLQEEYCRPKTLYQAKYLSW